MLFAYFIKKHSNGLIQFLQKMFFNFISDEKVRRMARTCRRGERGGGGLGDKQKRETSKANVRHLNFYSEKLKL